jgi:hypothetical protein
MQIVIAPGGTARCVYSEDLDLRLLGELQIRRASRVEPDAAGRWWADLSPVGGPRLGPFQRRSLALQAETTWLLAHWPVPGNGGRPKGGVDEDVRAAGRRLRRGPGAGGLPGLLPRREAVGRRRRGPSPEGAGA